MNDIMKLAQWFVIAIRKRHWKRADFGGTHMAHAKRLLEMGYKIEEIQGCCFALVRNPDQFDGWGQGWELKYMVTILKGEPPFVEQWLRPPEPPAIYEAHNYDLWVQNWGKKAIRLGMWDGIYACVDEPYRLSAGALRIILGDDDAVQKSLEAKRRNRPSPAASGLRQRR